MGYYAQGFCRSGRSSPLRAARALRGCTSDGFAKCLCRHTVLLYGRIRTGIPLSGLSRSLAASARLLLRVLLEARRKMPLLPNFYLRCNKSSSVPPRHGAQDRDALYGQGTAPDCFLMLPSCGWIRDNVCGRGNTFARGGALGRWKKNCCPWRAFCRICL